MSLSSQVLCRFSSAIEAINDRLEQYAGGRKQVKYLDCSSIFVEDNAKVRTSLVCKHIRSINIFMLHTCQSPAQSLHTLLLSDECQPYGGRWLLSSVTFVMLARTLTIVYISLR